MNCQFLLLFARNTGIAGICGLFLTQCASKPTPSSIQPSLMDTPPHNMARSEYPFDEKGRYRKDWVKSGSTKRPDERQPAPPTVHSYGARTSVTVPVKPSNTVAPPPRIPVPSAQYHKVVSGDTLFSIGRRYGMSVSDLKRRNGLTSDMIRVGQSLRVR